jgi:hypothetical protein
MAHGTASPRVIVEVSASWDRAVWRESCLSQRRKLPLRTSGLSCEAETCRARWRLVGGGSSSRELVGDAPNWSEIRRLASDGLGWGP